MRELREIMENNVVWEKARDTDKSTGRRPHVDLYERVFPEYRESATSMFEIGIYKGGSIRSWHEYFPNATIYAVDFDPEYLANVEELGLDRAVPVQLDQSKPEDLEHLASLGPFDIGIDDGSHIWSHQILTFEKLWPAIKPGGLYVLEDTMTSYQEWLDHTASSKSRHHKQVRGMGGYDQGISCMDYFKNLLDEINIHGINVWVAPEKWTEMQRTVEWIGFRTDAVFIRKRLQQDYRQDPR